MGDTQDTVLMAVTQVYNTGSYYRERTQEITWDASVEDYIISTGCNQVVPQVVTQTAKHVTQTITQTATHKTTQTARCVTQ